MSHKLTSDLWISLVIGNTRLHWGLFDGQALRAVHHTPHLITAHDVKALINNGFSYPDSHRPQSLWLASVVPTQTSLCLQSPINCYVARRSRVPLANVYPTLGIDRAINLLGARERVGWPVLVIDAGTALTFTAGAFTAGAFTAGAFAGAFTAGAEQLKEAAVYGGAILPGIRLQGAALGTGTAALDEAIASSQTIFNQAELPPRWASDTSGAIASGLIYGTLATLIDTLTDWWQQFPEGKAVLTGGDSLQLLNFLQQKTPEIASRVSIEENLSFYGMSAYRQHLTT